MIGKFDDRGEFLTAAAEVERKIGQVWAVIYGHVLRGRKASGRS